MLGVIVVHGRAPSKNVVTYEESRQNANRNCNKRKLCKCRELIVELL